MDFMETRKQSEIYEERYEKSYKEGNMNDARYWRRMMILAKEREKIPLTFGKYST